MKPRSTRLLNGRLFMYFGQAGVTVDPSALELPHDDFGRAHHEYRGAHDDCRRSYYDFRMTFVSRVPAIIPVPVAFRNKASAGR